jgi:hypothetical protein
MAYAQEEFKFPDEIEVEDSTPEIEIEIEDDTPEEDRGRQPMPKEIVQDLEQDELEEYDAAAKEKLKQLKKVWHDERRAKEQAHREQQEAVALAKRLYDENQKLRSAYTTGEKEYISTAQQAAQYEVESAKRAYKEAYEAGDTDGVIEAQERLNLAQLKHIRASNLKETTLQPSEDVVQQYHEQPQSQQPQTPQLSPKTIAWAERNPWYGQDRVMTSAAYGVHLDLVEKGYTVDSDEYYSALDKTVHKMFGEYFGEQPKATKPKTVVAPATRSTSSNKIKLSQSQVQLAKKLGLSPEIYAKEVLKLENR